MEVGKAYRGVAPVWERVTLELMISILLGVTTAIVRAELTEG
jgi:hypothetical protein